MAKRSALEARIATIEELLHVNREKIRKMTNGIDFGTQTDSKTLTCGSTQTSTPTSDTPVQTSPIRKNITERNIQIDMRPETATKSTQATMKPQHTCCGQAKSNNSTAGERLIQKMSTDILPLIKQLSPQWITVEDENNMLKHPLSDCLTALDRINSNNIRVHDVVLLIQTSLEMLIGLYTQPPP